MVQGEARMTVSIVMAVYGQPLMLKKWWEAIRNYSRDERDSIELIIVDDHGIPPVKIPEDIQEIVRCKLFLVQDDIHWNQMGARNLGMQHASPGPCIMLDPDMVIEPGMMQKMISAAQNMGRNQVIKLGLKHMDGSKKEINMSSPNFVIISKENFDKVKGYDEDFAGHKGYSDVHLHFITNEMFQFVRRPNLYASFYSTAEVEDAAVMTLDRDYTHNRAIWEKKKAECRTMRGWRRWVQNRPDNRIRFSWMQVH